MPRDAVSIVNLATGAGTAPGSGTAINVTNGATIAAAGETRRLIVHVKNSAGSSKNVTIKAGVYPPAFRQGIGDVVVAVANSGEQLIIVESARHVQSDGSIWLDYESGMTGTAFAYQLPKDN
jgi:hypothetical protein